MLVLGVRVLMLAFQSVSVRSVSVRDGRPGLEWPGWGGRLGLK